MEILWPLPITWNTKKLSEVAEEESQQVVPNNYPQENFNYWGLDVLENGQRTEPIPNIVKGSDIHSTCVKFSSQHVLYSKLRPYLNKVITPSQNGIGTTEWIVIRPNQSIIDRKYLAYVLRSPLFVSFATRNSKGARLPRISKTIFWRAEIPLPYPERPEFSLKVQRQIVARIEALLSEVREMREINQRIIEDTNSLLLSTLGQLFPNPDRLLPKGWRLKTIEEISKNPQYGFTTSAKSEPVGPKFLRITDIQNGMVDWNTVPFCECNQREVDRYRLFDGDIVFARTGATTGKTFLISTPPEAVFASYLIRLQIERDASPDFVYWFFQSPYYWRQINPRGGAQPNMNAQLLKKVKIPVPENHNIQDKIISQVNSIQNEILQMQKDQNATEKMILDLEQAILAQAFRGEL